MRAVGVVARDCSSGITRDYIWNPIWQSLLQSTAVQRDKAKTNSSWPDVKQLRSLWDLGRIWGGWKLRRCRPRRPLRSNDIETRLTARAIQPFSVTKIHGNFRLKKHVCLHINDKGYANIQRDACAAELCVPHVSNDAWKIQYIALGLSCKVGWTLDASSYTRTQADSYDRDTPRLAEATGCICRRICQQGKSTIDGVLFLILENAPRSASQGHDKRVLKAFFAVLLLQTVGAWTAR